MEHTFGGFEEGPVDADRAVGKVDVGVTQCGELSPAGAGEAGQAHEGVVGGGEGSGETLDPLGGGQLVSLDSKRLGVRVVLRPGVGGVAGKGDGDPDRGGLELVGVEVPGARCRGVRGRSACP